LALVLVALAMLLIWRLYDLFRPKGKWSEELAEDSLDVLPTSKAKTEKSAEVQTS
jgi:hypothetical protein